MTACIQLLHKAAELPAVTVSPGCQGLMGYQTQVIALLRVANSGLQPPVSVIPDVHGASRMVHSGPIPAGSPGVRASTGCP